MQNWNSRDHDILAKTIFAESWGEDISGQYAVGHVIMTRAKANRSYWGGSTIAGVCLQPGQFECWNNKNDIPIRVDDERRAYNRIYQWVPDLLNGRIPDPSYGCDYYNNPSIESGTREPQWVKQARAEGKRTMDIGNHRFYHIGH